MISTEEYSSLLNQNLSFTLTDNQPKSNPNIKAGKLFKIYRPKTSCPKPCTFI